ncbi:MAG: type IV secretory system conjugative DNA transfer family protein [Clostridia bacterium]|nr:type IV secretory system conjugative DNA transfer family protein [Clostridia bacterium]
MSNHDMNNRDRRYFEQLLKKADEENRSNAAEAENSLLSEDPLGINHARWATDEEMKASLVEIPNQEKEAETAGVPLLCRDGAVYADGSDSHTLIIGASGSKKTRLFILPTILTLMKAGESMIVTDPKAELFERTSGRLRENGYEALCINFRDDSRQNCWNPLKAPREFFQKGKFDLAVGLMNDFSTIAVPAGRNGSDPFWDDAARSTFMGLLLLMFLLAEDPAEINIRGLLRMRNSLFNATDDKNTPFRQLHTMLDPGSIAASYLSNVAIAPERTLASILATLDTHLIKFIMRPDLTDMLCHDDIDFHAIGHQKTAVFLVMPDEKETYHGLISIFIQQCYESLIFEAQNLPGKTLPRRVNFLLDEFSSLPPIKEFPAMISAARSRNIRFDIVVQSEKQLRSRYHEEAETIKGNCNNWVFLYSRELETLEEICRLCGNQKSGNPLITPSRLQRLDKQQGEVLVIHGRNYPFLSHLDDVNVYDNEEFLPVYCKPASEEPLRVFMVDELLKKHSRSWFIAKLAQNTVKQAEIEELEKAAEAKKAAELEEKLRRERRLTVIDWLPVQTASLAEDPILAASRDWYSRTHTAEPAPLFGYECNIHPNEEQSGTNMFLPACPFSLNYISLVSELNPASVALVGEDSAILSAAAHHVYRRCLAAGQVVPIYFNLQDLVTDWNKIVCEYKKEEMTLLHLLLAKQLFGTQMPPDQESLKKASFLIKEFSKEPEGMPRYLLILDRMDLSPLAMDAIWHTRNAEAHPNVRLFVTTAIPELLKDNCVEYFSKATFHSPLDTKNPPEHSVKNYLYFDETDNNVKAKQGPAPAIQLEVHPCSRS